MACHANRSDNIDHTPLEQHQKKNTQTNFASPSRNTVKKQEVGDNLSICMLNLLLEVSNLPSLVIICLPKKAI